MADDMLLDDPCPMCGNNPCTCDKTSMEEKCSNCELPKSQCICDTDGTTATF